MNNVLKKYQKEKTGMYCKKRTIKEDYTRVLSFTFPKDQIQATFGKTKVAMTFSLLCMINYLMSY